MEHSLLLRPSLIEGAGVGCFAASTIPEGVPINTRSEKLQLLSRQAIGEIYLKFCIYRGDDQYLAPPDFSTMHMLWYANHSRTPNLELRDRKLWTRTEVTPDEELTLYYPDLLTHPVNLTWVQPEDI